MSQEPTRNRAGRINLGIGSTRKVDFPNLIDSQLNSFRYFVETGVKTLFNEINPVKDTMERMWTLEFKDYRIGDPYRSIDDATDKGLSYEAPIYSTVQLLNNKTGEIKEQEIFVADLPLMTNDGFFVVNGVRRVVTHQIVRAEGVLFEENEVLPSRTLYKARLMPGNGPWYEFEVSKHNVISIRLIPKRPRVLITELFRVFGYETDEEIKALFSSVDTHEEYKYIESTLARDFTKNKEEAIVSVYNKLRPDESVTLDSAEKYIKGHFFNIRKFDLGKVGRYQINRKLGMNYPVEGNDSKLHVDDLVSLIKKLIEVNNGVVAPDDIDHLSNRRIRSVGEVLLKQLAVGVRRLEKNIKDKMSMYGQDAKLTPSMLISTKPVSAAMQSFFGSNQLSTFMEQSNILSELENKRKVTASGPGGLVKERATFSVREVHNSHYSRFDPVTSPESQAIGVVTQLAILSRVNDYGFIEAPYRKVLQTAKNDGRDTINRLSLETIKVGSKTIVKAGQLITPEIAKHLKAEDRVKEIKVVSYMTDEIVYFDARDEEEYSITSSTVKYDQYGNILDALVPARNRGLFILEDVQNVSFMDLIASQQAGLGMALIPFVAHDDSMRALAGSNMQRQAVPLLKQEAPLIGTGLEEVVARQSIWSVFAEDDGVVEYADATKLTVKYKEEGRKDYVLRKFYRSNDNTSFSQYVRVEPGQKFNKGDVLVDGPTMINGELAIGTNLRAALMFYDGYNYEDSVIISERVVKDDLLTSVHIREHTVEVRDTELGAEIITADIPHVNERILQKLDDRGIVRTGVRVKSGDILVGVVAPRGEQELTAEERLLRAIFGEASSDVRDNSLRLPHGESGIVIHTQVLSSENDDKLAPGVLHEVKVWVAKTKKISYGDKISGRHGDKNTVAAIKPVEDMPFTADGEPVDIVLTPTFIKRMNMGQAVEVHFGEYASMLGEKLAFPLFEDINMEWVETQMKKNGFKMEQKVDLFDGRTGEKLPRKITVGMKYILKLHHIADEKVHARSTGPYTVVTQQPLGGKAQMGGQRFGEMEVWALEAHGAPATLQEMLTIKSDDVKGRSSAYKAIIQGEKIENVNVPESFKVLIKELNALSLKIDLISSKPQVVEVEQNNDEPTE
ncbi:MAG: DNA-directed RNA polymerase subunit beta [candidate division WS6 bacterium GW2011_GWF2_39_15]|uniref:DNA-directed RNA polymerase subunit beta n=1 Tax=candidate division WS6 bacterium GW2011_GWF2_39_15 TaxID=1619100 RepID=A0A0G0MYA7_9BACT|nr:MAG: DNA-directed RNA polymerase subunit beta [candidate division WS6 bacterium GW2011_GWF2_39_15]